MHQTHHCRPLLLRLHLRGDHRTLFRYSMRPVVIFINYNEIKLRYVLVRSPPPPKKKPYNIFFNRNMQKRK